MPSCGTRGRVSLVWNNVSKESMASSIRVGTISELGTTLAITKFLLTLFLTRLFFLPWWQCWCVATKRRFLQEPHRLTSQKTAFFIVTAVKTSYIGYSSLACCLFWFIALFNLHTWMCRWDVMTFPNVSMSEPTRAYSSKLGQWELQFRNN
jgi:hypothetical protein